MTPIKMVTLIIMSLFLIYLVLKLQGLFYIFYFVVLFCIFMVRPGTAQQQSNKGSEADVEKFRRKLKERGGTGILGLGRQFRV